MSQRDITAARRLLAPDTACMQAHPHPDSGMILTGIASDGYFREFNDLLSVRRYAQKQPKKS